MEISYFKVVQGFFPHPKNNNLKAYLKGKRNQNVPLMH